MTTLAALVLALVPAGDADVWPANVETALVFAGANRPEIERVLTHYAAGDDEQKLHAAFFLIANMPGCGYIEYGLFDEYGTEVEYDALASKNYDEAQAALDTLELSYGELDFQKKVLVEDLHTMTADQLIENIDLAFAAWRGNPWAKEVSFETFCEFILPHRGSNEPIEPWRPALMTALNETFSELEGETSTSKIAQLASKAATSRIGFTSLYYLHPTDQGFAEMCSSGLGRCEDITNMTTYAMRAAAVVSAADYTPWWAHRDNNHAWPVTLDGNGFGNHGDGRGAAKVYRRTYSKRLDNLCYQLPEGEEGPPYINRDSYIDVTDQYCETTDVTVQLPADYSHDVAYVCVFNGGEWKPIHWGHVDAGRVTFTSMGRGLLYLPADWKNGSVLPAAAPFFLTKSGEVQPLQTSASFTVAASLFTETKRKPKLDEAGERISQLKAGASYEVLAWHDGWQTLGRHSATAEPIAIDLPAGGLYWLVEKDSRKLERPFTIRDGEQRFF